ncbi:transposase [Microtetraspora sp. NBRC 16547]|uniref:transposase n=1 Tax=Microtetraspora sp. NBRC 16547 TaxID=3030993 RepID=UPI002553E9E0|nr:transposase [Microtetraspora sp. NBRC 16547]
MSERKPYPSDLSDERCALIEPVITAWKAAHPSVSGHQGSYEMREIVNAILYQSRTGCQWDYLPHDLPPRSAVLLLLHKFVGDRESGRIRHRSIIHPVGRDGLPGFAPVAGVEHRKPPGGAGLVEACSAV